MIIHVNKGIKLRVNAIESTMTSRLRDFVRMNPLFFFLSLRWEKIPQEFLNGLYKVLSAMGVTSR